MWLCCECEGTGEVEVVGDSVTDVCDKCGGTGFFCEMRTGDFCTLGSPCPHQKPMTNEEWLKQCTTEQLANAFFEYRYVNATPRQKLWMSASEECIKTDIVDWLKQPHTEKE